MVSNSHSPAVQGSVSSQDDRDLEIDCLRFGVFADIYRYIQRKKQDGTMWKQRVIYFLNNGKYAFDKTLPPGFPIAQSDKRLLKTRGKRD